MMLNRIFLLLTIFLLSGTASAGTGSGLDACTNLASPFDSLAQMSLDTSVSNPPKVQLCHRVSNAERHFDDENIDKTVTELHKYITEVEQSTPKHIEGSYAQALIAEANRIISMISGDYVIEGKVSGGVFSFTNSTPIASATVTLSFIGSDQIYATQSDENGFFNFEHLPLTGEFIVNATDTSGAQGSVSGSLLENDSQESVLVAIDQPGSGVIHGSVTGSSSSDTVITAIFPESKREYHTAVNSDGTYKLDGLHTDGTVIVIAFDNASGASASYSSVLTPYYSTVTVNLTLITPSAVNSEFINTNFANGLDGWTYSGPIQIVDRNLVFDAQN